MLIRTGAVLSIKQMSMEVSVCHVVNSVGDTSMPADLATAQSKDKRVSQVGILSFFEADSFRDDDLINVYCLNIDGKYLYINYGQYRKITRILSKYDIVHTHHPHSGFYAKIIAQKLGKPIISTHHNSHQGFTIKGKIANAATDVFADRIIPVSKSVEKSFNWWERVCYYSGNVEVINNGINLERIEKVRTVEWDIYKNSTVGRNSIIVGSAGALTEQKGHETLISGIEHVNKRSNKPIELVISGDGPMREKLSQRIHESRYENYIHLLGFLEKREQVYKMMEQIDIYAMPSRWEGFCVAALEAMAIKNPCIFSEIPAFREPFGSVAKFHPVDDSRALSDKVNQLLINNKKREELAESAQKLILNQYDIENTAEDYVHQYLPNV